MTDITQADRDAVEGYGCSLVWEPLEKHFARHREAAFQAGVKAGLQAAAKAVAGCFEDHIDDYDNDDSSAWTDGAAFAPVSAPGLGSPRGVNPVLG